MIAEESEGIIESGKKFRLRLPSSRVGAKRGEAPEFLAHAETLKKAPAPALRQKGTSLGSDDEDADGIRKLVLGLGSDDDISMCGPTMHLLLRLSLTSPDSSIRPCTGDFVKAGFW
jgi:hypothetical protein